MVRIFCFITMFLCFHPAWAQNLDTTVGRPHHASIYWIQVKTDSGVIHAAVATPTGTGPFPAVIILHGTHGFAQEYINIARRLADSGIVGIAACWFAGRKDEGR